MLIIFRGNSGSGKSTTAKLLRQTLLKKTRLNKVALIEQDYLRRLVLKEKEAKGTDNIKLIEQTVLFALTRDYAVILEGILFSERYKDMIRNLVGATTQSYMYYFDISLRETLRRHQTKPDAHEFGEKEMKEWYNTYDVLGFDGEQVITEGTSQQQIVEKVLQDIKVGLKSKDK